MTAFWNVCFSPEHVSIMELDAFTEDVQRETVSNVDLESLHWIRHRRVTGHREQAI